MIRQGDVPRRASAASLVALLLLTGACSRKPDPAQVYGNKCKSLMVSWKRDMESASATFDARLAPVPRRERRSFLVNEMRDEAAIHERTLASLEALGPPPEVAREMVSTTREMLTFLSRSARARAAATERRDRSEMARVDEEFARELPRLQANLVKARNSVARNAGFAELSEAEILAKPDP